MLKSIYVPNNMASLLDNCKLILGITLKISRPEIIPNLGLKARPLYWVEINTKSMKPQSYHIIHQSDSKISQLSGISQAT